MGLNPIHNDCRPVGRWHWAALLCVLILAAGLRFGGITRVGIRYGDEAWYVSDARLWHRCVRVITDPAAIEAVFQGNKQAFQERMDAMGVDFAMRYTKPSQGYTFLGTLMMFVVGDRPAALLVTNALCGTLAVAVLYALGATLFDRRIALCAALLLAVSPYHLVHCRSAFPEATMGLFILMGVLVWSLGYSGRWRWRRAYLLSGIALGYAATCHYRGAYVPLALVLVELLTLIPGRRQSAFDTPSERGSLLRRWAIMTAGFAMPLLAIEGVFWLARLAAVVSDSYLPLTTFFEAGWRKISGIPGVGPGENRLWNPHILAAYWSYFVHWHGLGAMILAGVGLLIALRAKGAAKLPAVLVVVTAALLVSQQYHQARVISCVVPFVCLLLAVGLVWLVSRCRPVKGLRPAMAVCLIVVAAGPAMGKAWDLCGKRSQLEEACAYVAQHGAGTLVVNRRCEFRVYLEGSGVSVEIASNYYEDSCPPKEALKRLRAEGVRWVIVEPWHWGFHRESHLFKQCQGLDELLAQEAVLAAEFPHLSDYRWEFLSERALAGLANLPEMTRKDGGPLRIYDLQAPL